MTFLRALPLVATFALPAPVQAETFILVHGAFQTSAAWDGTITALAAAGHEAIAVNLPGRSGDGRAPGEVTMQNHVDAVLDSIEVTGDGPVVLVGHSFGGMTISAVAEAAPERIATLIYVAAYLPAVDVSPGESMQDLALLDHHGGWRQDSFVIAPDYSTASVNQRDRAALFANDAPDALAASIAAAMVDEPLAPVATPVALTSARFGQVRAAYVVTLRDRAVSTALQLTMLGRGRVAEAVPLDTGHVPHLVDPQAMAVALIRAATPAVE